MDDASRPVASVDAVKWVATAIQLVGYGLTGLNIVPWNVVAFVVGIVLWFVVGMMWKDRAIMVVHVGAFVVAYVDAKIDQHALSVEDGGLFRRTAFRQDQRRGDSGLCLKRPNVAAERAGGKAVLVPQIRDRAVLPCVTNGDWFGDGIALQDHGVTANLSVCFVELLIQTGERESE